MVPFDDVIMKCVGIVVYFCYTLCNEEKKSSNILNNMAEINNDDIPNHRGIVLIHWPLVILNDILDK